MTHLKLLDGFKYKSKGENNRRKKNWGALLADNTLEVERRVGASGWGLEIVTSKSIIHIDLHKPNNKLIIA
jgi:hypothetical protein